MVKRSRNRKVIVTCKMIDYYYNIIYAEHFLLANKIRTSDEVEKLKYLRRINTSKVNRW